MINRTRHGIRILTAAALAGATIATGGGATWAQTTTASGASAAKSRVSPARTGEIDCPRGYLCLYDHTYYRWGMVYNKPTTKHPYKCNGVKPWIVNAPAVSYQNRTTYKVQLLNSNWKRIRTIPQRHVHGAFSPKSGIKGNVAYACFYKP
ncbi:peptidase inhibitor family I36 protein [Actinoallomurus sp. NPDC052274]|uniref:peptidase inhibitor family I36 protein n=1 Tax=Actinoallomurus sp. NPDC052274 TaxID=3155420 RepID=UPI00343D8015